MAMGVRLTVDMPGDGPDLGIAGLQQASVAPRFFAEGAGDGGEGLNRDKDVGAGGPPGRAVRGEATPGHNVMDVRVGLQVPAPGVQDPREPRESGPNEGLIVGESFEGRCRGVEHGLGGGTLG